jgi:hypothetical protein
MLRWRKFATCAENDVKITKFKAQVANLRQQSFLA